MIEQAWRDARDENEQKRYTWKKKETVGRRQKRKERELVKG